MTDKLEAALAAGFADALTEDWPGDTKLTTAPAIARYLMGRPDVQAAIDEGLDPLADIRHLGNPDFLRHVQEVLDAHVTKAAGYAGSDEPDTWSNFREAIAWGLTPLQGCLVRMGDKYRRVQNLRRNAANDRVGESIKDTLMDLANYAIIAVCLMDEEATEAARLHNDALFREQGLTQPEGSNRSGWAVTRVQPLPPPTPYYCHHSPACEGDEAFCRERTRASVGPPKKRLEKSKDTTGR